jgi:hypothetical protein
MSFVSEYPEIAAKFEAIWEDPDLNTRLADDSVPGDGAQVNKWLDSSGNGHDLVAAVSNDGHFLETNYVNGKAVLRMATGAVQLAVPYTSALNGVENVWFFVGRVEGSASGAVIRARGATDTTSGCSLDWASSTQMRPNVYNDADTLRAVNTSSGEATSWNIWRYEAQNSSGAVRAYRGDKITTEASTNIGGSGIDPNEDGAFALPAFNTYACRAVMVLKQDEQLSEFEIRRINDYFARDIYGEPTAAGPGGALDSAEITGPNEITYTFDAPAGSSPNDAWDDTPWLYLNIDTIVANRVTCTRPTTAGGTTDVVLSAVSLAGAAIETGQLKLRVTYDDIFMDGDVVEIGDGAGGGGLPAELVIDSSGNWTQAVAAGGSVTATAAAGVYGKPSIEIVAIKTATDGDLRTRMAASDNTLDIYIQAQHWSDISTLSVKVTDGTVTETSPLSGGELTRVLLDDMPQWLIDQTQADLDWERDRICAALMLDPADYPVNALNYIPKKQWVYKKTINLSTLNAAFTSRTNRNYVEVTALGTGVLGDNTGDVLQRESSVWHIYPNGDAAWPGLAGPSAATIYVDPTRPDDTGDGLTAGAAKKTFSAARAAVGYGGTIRVIGDLTVNSFNTGSDKNAGPCFIVTGNTSRTADSITWDSISGRSTFLVHKDITVKLKGQQALKVGTNGVCEHIGCIIVDPDTEGNSDREPTDTAQVSLFPGAYHAGFDGSGYGAIYVPDGAGTATTIGGEAEVTAKVKAFERDFKDEVVYLTIGADSGYYNIVGMADINGNVDTSGSSASTYRAFILVQGVTGHPTSEGTYPQSATHEQSVNTPPWRFPNETGSTFGMVNCYTRIMQMGMMCNGPTRNTIHYRIAGDVMTPSATNTTSTSLFAFNHRGQHHMDWIQGYGAGSDSNTIILHATSYGGWQQLMLYDNGRGGHYVGAFHAVASTDGDASILLSQVGADGTANFDNFVMFNGGLFGQRMSIRAGGVEPAGFQSLNMRVQNYAGRNFGVERSGKHVIFDGVAGLETVNTAYTVGNDRPALTGLCPGDLVEFDLLDSDFVPNTSAPPVTLVGTDFYPYDTFGTKHGPAGRVTYGGVQIPPAEVASAVATDANTVRVTWTPHRTATLTSMDADYVTLYDDATPLTITNIAKVGSADSNIFDITVSETLTTDSVITMDAEFDADGSAYADDVTDGVGQWGGDETGIAVTNDITEEPTVSTPTTRCRAYELGTPVNVDGPGVAWYLDNASVSGRTVSFGGAYVTFGYGVEDEATSAILNIPITLQGSPFAPGDYLVGITLYAAQETDSHVLDVLRFSSSEGNSASASSITPPNDPAIPVPYTFAVTVSHTILNGDNLVFQIRASRETGGEGGHRIFLYDFVLPTKIGKCGGAGIRSRSRRYRRR